MRLLIKELPAFIQHIQESQQRKDYDAMYEHVHKLHGALSYCDMPHMKSIIQKIERDLKSSRNETIDSDLDALFLKLTELMRNTEI
jgi:two-component system sensor histidine kinase BarA